MTHDQLPPEKAIESQRPLEFRSNTEEAAVGALMGCMYGSMAALVLGGFVGALGANLANRVGIAHEIGGSVFIWIMFCALPLALMKVRIWWLCFTCLTLGAGCLFFLQNHIHQRDIGAFYPWI